MTPGQRKLALGLGVAVAAGAVVFAVQAYIGGPQPQGGTPQSAGGAGASRTEPSLAVVEEVRVSRLAQPVPTLPEQGRDPFRFRPAPPPPSSRPAPVRAPVMLGPPAPLPPAPPAAVPPPPPIPLKFVGLVEAGGGTGKVAVLSDSKGGVFYGREGDIIDGRYRLVKVTADQAELVYPDGRGRQSLRLSGQ